MQDATAKLAQCEASLRRWHSRLTRASNMLQKLERQRRRLAGTIANCPVPKLGAAVAAVKATAPPDELAIPPFLDRKDPLVAERMTAARKAAEAEARKRMPLTGRAALDAIKGKRNKAKATA